MKISIIFNGIFIITLFFVIRGDNAMFDKKEEIIKLQSETIQAYKDILENRDKQIKAYESIIANMKSDISV